MFDSFKRASWLAKLVTIFVAGILLGLGLCGVGAGLSNAHSQVADSLGEVGATSFGVSAFGLFMTVFFLLLFGLDKKPRIKRGRSIGKKICVVSAVGMLLSFGLCASVSGEVRDSWRLSLGMFLFSTSCVGLFVGAIWAWMEIGE